MKQYGGESWTVLNRDVLQPRHTGEHQMGETYALKVQCGEAAEG